MSSTSMIIYVLSAEQNSNIQFGRLTVEDEVRDLSYSIQELKLELWGLKNRFYTYI